MKSTLQSKSVSQNLGFDPGYLDEFEAKVFIEGAQARRRLVNFFVLLLLATVIANYGNHSWGGDGLRPARLAFAGIGHHRRANRHFIFCFAHPVNTGYHHLFYEQRRDRLAH